MNPHSIIAAIVVAITLLAGSYWKGRVDASAKTAICEARSADKDAYIDTQNEAVKLLKSESVRKAEAADKALANAKRETAKGKDRIAKLLAAQPGADACASASALIRESIQ